MKAVEVAAFYKFVALPHFAELRKPLRELCNSHGIRGTILLAPEGINGTIAGPPEGMDHMLRNLRAIAEFSDLDSKHSFSAGMPFQRMKVRLKKEIVTLGVPGVDPTVLAGTYVTPHDWNALISDPQVLLIDTRNTFEVKAGSFSGAIDPGTKSFGEFPVFVREKLAGARQRKIALFCTGGIRCEKATSFLKQEGFAQVYHLKGGILKYLEKIPAAQSLWQGSCFVFDERKGLGHGLEVNPPTDEPGS